MRTRLDKPAQLTIGCLYLSTSQWTETSTFARSSSRLRNDPPV